MRSLFYLLLTTFLLSAVLGTNIASAHDEDKKTRRQLLLQEALSNVPGHNLTALSVELAPGNISPSHKHDAFVFVYLLSGHVRSQLGKAPPVDYSAGDSWVEPPGSIHTLTQNLSTKEPAKLLAIFVHKEGNKLTTSGEIAQ